MSTYIIHTARKAKKTDSIELVKDCLNLGYIRSCWMGGAPKNLNWLSVKYVEVITEDGTKEIRYPKTV